MSYNFPDFPFPGQVFAASNGPNYVWDGQAWRVPTSGTLSPPLPGVHYHSVAAATAANIPGTELAITLDGYAAPGDGGGASYKRVLAEPAHAGKFQSADGAWWELALESIPNVRAWGALPGLANDATTGIQALLDYYAIAAATLPESGGGLVNLGDGLYRLTAPLNVKSRNILIRGNGKRNTQGSYDALRSEAGPGSFYADHAGSAIVLDATYSLNGFQFRDASLTNAVNRPVGSKGIEFITRTAFRREFVIADAAITNFESAIYVSKVGAEAAMGVIRIHRCNLMFNGSIHNQDATAQWNAFSFKDNDAGQNATRGIYVKAQNFICKDNVLEGQPDPVKIEGSYRASVIEGNYFEANTGSACIEASSIRHGRIGPNFYHTVTTDYKCRIVNARGIAVRDPAFVGVSSLCSLPDYRSTRGGGEEEITAPAGLIYWGHVGRPQSAFVAPKGAIVPSLYAPDVRETWLDGRVIGSREYTSVSTGILTFTYTIAANAGDIIVANTLLKYTDAPSSARFQMNVNSSTDPAKGSSGPSWEFASVPLGEWVMATTAARALEAVTTFQVSMYPWNISPAAGLYCRYQRPILNVVTSPSDIVPWYDIERTTKHTAAPTAGTWVVGDKIYHLTPAAAGFIGWVCTAAGTPGTWKTFGAITA